MARDLQRRFERDAEPDRLEADEAGEREREATLRPVSPGKVSRSSQLGNSVGQASPVAPGKRATTARIVQPSAGQAALQHRRAWAPGVDERDELEIAARGLTDSGGPLPYLEEIERAFGRHHVSDIRVATGGEARSANEEMGSVAYAMGDAIVFRESSPDLFTVAHEAAHVIQQRAGSVATGTVGQAGDRHEAHADAVAERVVRGESAEDLLDQVAPGGPPAAAPSGPASVQRLDDADYEGLTTVQAIHQALDDDEADDALTLMGRLDGADQANVVLISYQSMATGCFGDGEMAEAAAILVAHGGSLGRALDWMYDEGTDWGRVARVLDFATDGQKAALTSDVWRNRFVSELGEDEMSELVDLLDLRLSEKLDWMWRAGADGWDAVKSKIEAAPPDQRLALVTDVWRDWFVDDVVDGNEMSELVNLLGMDLETKVDWLHAAGSDPWIVELKVAGSPPAEKTPLVTDAWRDRFVEELDDESMPRLVGLLPLRLSDKLDWMWRAGADDWGAVKSKIEAAPPDQRLALVTDEWRDWFVDDVVDGREMSELVNLLGMDLETKVQWMHAAGSDPWIIELKIASSPPAEKALLVTDAWRDRFVEELDDESMPRLVDLLPLRLSDKLDWMWRAGADGWAAVKSKIEAAPPDQRLALVTDVWRDWFVDDVVDNEEMSELVDLLGMDLVTKLDWLRAEGADYEAVIGKISTAPPAERPAVYDSDLREFFVEHCDNEEMAVVVILLGGTVAQQLSWMAAEGSSAELVLDRVNAAPEPERPALYDDSAVVEMIREFDPRERVPIIEAAGGTPAQQMDLFGAEIHIRLLTWATPSADWVDAIMAVRADPLDLFEVAKGDPAGWGPFIEPRLWDLLKTHKETLYPEERVAVFWAAYGTGSSFTADQILHFFDLLFGRPIRPASEDIIIQTDDSHRTRFSVVAPTDDTARALMDCVRPGGGGPSGIGRAEVGTGTIAFCTHEHQEELTAIGWNNVSTAIVGSQFWHGYVIIKAVGTSPGTMGVQPGQLSTTPVAAASDGTPDTVGTGLNYFQNHVRHEIGHAVGAKAIGEMSQSGNEFAEKYGDWQVSSESEFLAAMWSGQSQPAGGWPSLAIGAASVTVTDDEVRDWCIAVISSGKEAANALGNTPGTFGQKKTALAGSIWGGEKMVALLNAIAGVSHVTEVPGNAYYFPGFTPPDPVPIFATRWGDKFVTYSLDAYTKFTNISWYARSSPAEMFAEMYTARYGGGTFPGNTSTGDAAGFFTELEAQRDPMFGEPPPELVESGR